MLNNEQKQTKIMNLQSIDIWFDGGCKPNPGEKYGSYSVNLNNNEIIKQSRIHFGYGTNNEAEFNSLIKCLNEVVRQLDDSGMDTKRFYVRIFTDSMIVKWRISKKNFKSKKSEPGTQEMARLAYASILLLNRFYGYSIGWNPRSINVSKFGH